jgi:steroid delta-isomerase-like uncharacterized protein
MRGRTKGVDPMSAEENKAVVRRVIEEMFNEGNLDAAYELIAPDYVQHDPAMPEEARGPEGYKEFAAAYRTAFPDLHMEVEAQIAEEDLVTTRWICTGTHEGNLMGLAPTGIRVRQPGMDISRVSEGKVAETWEGYNPMVMMQQLGMLPEPQQTEEASPT